METWERGRREEELILNMGPQHPSTHGVLRVVLTLEGELVVDAKPVIGYLHRGIEKIAENKQYYQVIPYTDRTDYVCAPINNLGYVLAVEKLLGIEAPERAQYVRVILAELSRIASHLVWLGTHAMDIGAITVFLYCLRERETILDLFEMFGGARLTTNIMRIGGFYWDTPPGWLEKVGEFCRLMPDRIREYEDLLTDNPIWIRRTKGVGILSAEDAIQYGVTGPMLRGSGVAYDVRKAHPYCVYDRLDFLVPTGSNGDSYDRYLVRLEEMRQSVRIIQQCLQQIPEGPMRTEHPQYVMPAREKVYTTIEEMTKHFVWVIHGIKPPVGEVYQAVESPKGELGYYIISDGTNRPYRMRIRPPSFVNLQALPAMVKGALVADVIAVIGTIDIVLGEVDR